MNCDECGGNYIKKTDTLEVTDPYVGKIIIRGVPYYQCDKCGDILYTPDMAQAIEFERNSRINELINQYSISSFVSASEAASLLGISRQALHKHRRIRQGFIYKTNFYGLTVYLRESVNKFKETGDGRFPLFRDYSTPIPYFAWNTPKSIPSLYTHIIDMPRLPKFNRKQISLKEHHYAN